MLSVIMKLLVDCVLVAYCEATLVSLTVNLPEMLCICSELWFCRDTDGAKIKMLPQERLKLFFSGVRRALNASPYQN